MSLITSSRILSFSLLSAMLYFFTRNGGFDYQSWFSYHPTAAAVAFVGLLPEVLSTALRLQNDKSIKSNSKKKEDLLTTHATFAFACKVFALISISAIYINKEVNERPHFVSNHAIAGAVTGLVLFVQVVLGVIQNPSLGLLSTGARYFVKSMHGICSSILIVVTSITMWYAFQTMYFQKYVLKNDDSATAITYGFGLAVPTVCLWAWISSLKNAKSL